MAGTPSYTLTCSYDELLFLAVAVEHFAARSRLALADIPLATRTAGERVRLEQQIAQADALLLRLNEARR